MDSKKSWYLSTGLVLALCLLEQLIKWIVITALGVNRLSLGPLSLVIDRGVAIGEAGLSSYFQSISTFAVAVFILFLFFIIHFVFNSVFEGKLQGLKIGISVLTAGILVDSIDVIFRGETISWFSILGSYFNLGSLYTLSGVLLVLFFIFKDRKTLFRKRNLRKQIFIDRDQWKFCGYILTCFLVLLCSYGGFFFLIIRAMFRLIGRQTGGMNMEIQMISIFSFSFLILTVLFLIIMSMFVIYLSNKVYGPVFGFKKYVEHKLLGIDKEGGPTRISFRVRKGDHFEYLGPLSEQLEARLNPKK